VEDIKEELYKRDQVSLEAIMRELDDDIDTSSILQQGKAYKKHLQAEDRYWEQRHFTVVINNLEEFLDKSDRKDKLSELDSEFIEDFQSYLIKDVKNANNTVRNKLQRLKGFTDWLQKNGHIENEPYRNIERVKSKRVEAKTKLSYQQIKDIQALNLEEGSLLWHTRNYFLYSFYNAGIRFGDLCTLEWKNLIDGRLQYKMHKTGGKKSIRQLEPMERILKHYRKPKQKKSDYIFPILDKKYPDPLELRKAIAVQNVQINRRLKDIAKKAGIEANISFHVSRHSWAQFGLENKLDLYSISKALGHSNLEVTEAYLKDFDEELLDKSMEKLYE
jgi:integrase